MKRFPATAAHGARWPVRPQCCGAHRTVAWNQYEMYHRKGAKNMKNSNIRPLFTISAVAHQK
jgi:hypothetical protein